MTGGEVIGYYESGIDNCLEGGTLDSVPFEFVGSDPSPGQTPDPPDLYTDQDVPVNESATLQVAAASEVSATAKSVQGTEGATTSGQVASFSGPDNQPASDYAATITWGDGRTSPGSVSQVGCQPFRVGQ